jgi:NIMA (never in mitosis gene a)-related kinase
MAALKPPFTAHDLSGLYKKVCAGVFERIPINYSNDLQSIISSLLKLEPKIRPDTEDLLNNPTIHKHYKGSIDN